MSIESIIWNEPDCYGQLIRIVHYCSSVRRGRSPAPPFWGLLHTPRPPRKVSTDVNDDHFMMSSTLQGVDAPSGRMGGVAPPDK